MSPCYTQRDQGLPVLNSNGRDVSDHLFQGRPLILPIRPLGFQSYFSSPLSRYSVDYSDLALKNKTTMFISFHLKIDQEKGIGDP